MAEERIQTLHPHPGKRGVNIRRDRYDTVRDAILGVLTARGPVPLTDLFALVAEALPGFEGSVSWYVMSVKLDLEARGEIERVPRASPQVVRLVAPRA